MEIIQENVVVFYTVTIIQVPTPSRYSRSSRDHTVNIKNNKSRNKVEKSHTIRIPKAKAKAVFYHFRKRQQDYSE